MEAQATIGTDSAAPARALSIALWLEPDQIQHENDFIRSLTLGLQSEGHQVYLVLPEECRLSAPAPLGVQTVQVRTTPWWRRFHQSPQVYSPAETLNKTGAQVLVVFGTHALAASHFEMVLRQIPTVFWCWDPYDLRAPLLQHPSIGQIVVGAEPMLERLRSRRLTAKSTLIRPGIYSPSEPPASASHRPREGPFCMVCLDWLSHASCFEPMLRACRKLADEGRDFLLFLYDSGEQKHSVWQAARRLGLLDRVNFVPYRQNCPALLAQANIYLRVLPGFRMDYQIIQAMAQGLAVIARPNPFADYLESDVCRLIQNDSPDAWYQQLVELMDHTAQRRALGLAALGQVHRRHSMSEMLARFIGVCRQTAGLPLPFRPSSVG